MLQSGKCGVQVRCHVTDKYCQDENLPGLMVSWDFGRAITGVLMLDRTLGNQQAITGIIMVDGTLGHRQGYNWDYNG